MTRDELLAALDTNIWDGGATDREVPEGFDENRVREVVWRWSEFPHNDLGALVVDETGWFWYITIRESRSIQFEDHVVRIIGPVEAKRAFDALFVPREDRLQAEEEWDRAKAKWAED